MAEQLIHAIRSRKGSFALEAAIFLPLALVAILLLHSYLKTYRLITYHAFAEDQITEELASVLPIGEGILSVVPEIPGLDKLSQGIDKVIPPKEAKALLTQIAVDGGSSLVLGQLIGARLNYWMQEVSSNAKIGLPSYKRKVVVAFEPQANRAFITYILRIPTMFGTVDHVSQTAVPLWTKRLTPPEEETESEDDALWMLDNFSRGERIRTLYNANLPKTFPKVARRDGGTFVALKSIDLTAPTYQDASKLRRHISGFINNVSSFEGGTNIMGKPQITVMPDEVQGRKLILILPTNGTDVFNSIASLISAEAVANGVVLQVEHRGVSKRYQKAAKPN